MEYLRIEYNYLFDRLYSNFLGAILVYSEISGLSMLNTQEI